MVSKHDDELLLQLGILDGELLLQLGILDQLLQFRHDGHLPSIILDVAA